MPAFRGDDLPYDIKPPAIEQTTLVSMFLRHAVGGHADMKGPVPAEDLDQQPVVGRAVIRRGRAVAGACGHDVGPLTGASVRCAPRVISSA